MLPPDQAAIAAYKERLSKAAMALPTVTCPHCQKVGKGNSMKAWHFDKCLLNPNVDMDNRGRKKKVKQTPEAIVNITRGASSRPEYICPHCGKIGKESVGMRAWHGVRCKWNPVIQDVGFPKDAPGEERYTQRDIDLYQK